MFFLKCFYHKDAFSHNACKIWINKEITFSLELSDSDEDVKEDIDKIDNFDDNINNNEQNIGLSDGNDDLNEVNDILDEWFAGEGADDGEVKVNRKVGETYLVYKQCQQKTLRCKTKKESCKETRASDKKVKLIQVEENDEAVEDGIEVREVPLKPVIAEDPIPKVKQISYSCMWSEKYKKFDAMGEKLYKLKHIYNWAHSVLLVAHTSHLYSPHLHAALLDLL